jgi:hypothetical protein
LTLRPLLNHNNEPTDKELRFLCEIKELSGARIQMGNINEIFMDKRSRHSKSRKSRNPSRRKVLGGTELYIISCVTSYGDSWHLPQHHSRLKESFVAHTLFDPRKGSSTLSRAFKIFMSLNRKTIINSINPLLDGFCKICDGTSLTFQINSIHWVSSLPGVTVVVNPFLDSSRR